MKTMNNNILNIKKLLHINDVQNYYIPLQKIHNWNSLSQLKLIGLIRNDWTLLSLDSFIDRSYQVADCLIYNYDLDDIITVKYNYIDLNSKINLFDGVILIQDIKFNQIFNEDYYYNLYKLYLSSLSHIDIIFINTVDEFVYDNYLEKLKEDLNLDNLKINFLAPLDKEYFDCLRYNYNLNYNYVITKEIMTKYFTKSPRHKFKHSKACLNLIKYLNI